jgi:hypothetical protein
MALKAKSSKKNLADRLIEEERLKKSFESSSAVSLKTLESIPGQGIHENEQEKSESLNEAVNESIDRPNESILTPVQPEITAEKAVRNEAPVTPVVMPEQQYIQPVNIQSVNTTPYMTGMPRPVYQESEYVVPRKKRGRPYQGYAENTHVQSIYVRNDLYEYIMTNYVGHGRLHQSFNKFVNAAINSYLRNIEEGR